MARIRTVKPEFWHDEELSMLTPEACLLAIGLLNFSDDEGFFKANPKLIEASLFPLRELSVSIHGLITELSNIGYIRVCDGSDGKKYGEVVNFKKHQKVNRPNMSKIKGLCKFSESSVIVQGGLTDGTGNREGEQGTGNRDQGMERGEHTNPPIDPTETIKPQAGKRYEFAEIYSKAKPFNPNSAEFQNAYFQAVDVADGEDVVNVAASMFVQYCEDLSKPIRFIPNAVKWLDQRQFSTDWKDETMKELEERAEKGDKEAETKYMKYYIESKQK